MTRAPRGSYDLKAGGVGPMIVPRRVISNYDDNLYSFKNVNSSGIDYHNRPSDSYACPDQRRGKRAKSTNIYT